MKTLKNLTPAIIALAVIISSYPAPRCFAGPVTANGSNSAPLSPALAKKYSEAADKVSNLPVAESVDTCVQKGTTTLSQEKMSTLGANQTSQTPKCNGIEIKTGKYKFRYHETIWRTAWNEAEQKCGIDVNHNGVLDTDTDPPEAWVFSEQDINSSKEFCAVDPQKFCDKRASDMDNDTWERENDTAVTCSRQVIKCTGNTKVGDCVICIPWCIILAPFY